MIPPSGYIFEEGEASGDLRAALAREINAFHARTVPHASKRFALTLHAQTGPLSAGLVGVLSWEWLFIEALWVSDRLRGQGVGRALMAAAEARAWAEGCRSAWLDTFQAKDFYLALGYAVFGQLEDFPPGQTRHFLRKALTAPHAPGR
jgi:GNAT superfamily N-acetyltransferase